jgi:hypothetical protein
MTTTARLYLPLALIFLGIQGCASILNDSNQNINVATSSGEKVTAKIDGMPIEIPGVASVKRGKADKIITVDDPRCAGTTILPSDVDNVFFINLLSGGVLGSTTDYATGRMWEYQETAVVSCRK